VFAPAWAAGADGRSDSGAARFLIGTRLNTNDRKRMKLSIIRCLGVNMTDSSQKNYSIRVVIEFGTNDNYTIKAAITQGNCICACALFI
jgi:hypothetical protein